MYAEERQQAMVREITGHGRRSVSALARSFAVTSETVRRDLSALERQGLVRRVHGGAVPAESLSSLEASVSVRESVHREGKERIARAAVPHLPPAGSTLLLDAGTTTGRLVESLPRDTRLTVFTHSVPLAGRLAALPHVTLHLLPGRVRPTTQAAVGAETVAALNRIRVDVAVVGSNGCSVRHGLSTPDPDEAAVKRALVAAGTRVVALVDASKIGVESTVSFAALSDVDTLVTDADLPPDHELHVHGPEVVPA
ncbi:MAG: DeoR/GlpR family DNA-binding transcription regulator [Actinobacteria bacterium]|jgi:DeoR family transcriptional regulator, fructose operon transcriptional repressor|nr:DeoR/GlpR family DNA-binding transcription regulator [Actinomycetota bacterium]MBU2110773.1 DeoR/GlpR family DNA-binding transcription regulator [Actinomycetota bacterium]